MAMIYAGGMMICWSTSLLKSSQFLAVFLCSVVSFSVCEARNQGRSIAGALDIELLRDKVFDCGSKLFKAQLVKRFPLIDRAAELKELWEKMQREWPSLLQAVFMEDAKTGDLLLTMTQEALQHKFFQQLSKTEMFLMCKRVMPEMWEEVLHHVLTTDQSEGGLLDWYLKRRSGLRTADCFVFDDRGHAKVVATRLSTQGSLSREKFCTVVDDLVAKRKYACRKEVFAGTAELTTLKSLVQDLDERALVSDEMCFVVCQGVNNHEDKGEWWLIHCEGSGENSLLTPSEACCLGVATLMQMLKEYVVVKREQLRKDANAVSSIKKHGEQKKLRDIFGDTVEGQSSLERLKKYDNGVRALCAGTNRAAWKDACLSSNRWLKLRQKEQALFEQVGVGRASHERDLVALKMQTEEALLARICCEAAEQLGSQSVSQSSPLSEDDVLAYRVIVACLLQLEADTLCDFEAELERRLAHLALEDASDVEDAVALIEGKQIREGCKLQWMSLVDCSERILAENVQLGRLNHLRAVVKRLEDGHKLVPDDVRSELKDLEAKVGSLDSSDITALSLHDVTSKDGTGFWFNVLITDFLNDLGGVGSRFHAAIENILSRVC